MRNSSRSKDLEENIQDVSSAAALDTGANPHMRSGADGCGPSDQDHRTSKVCNRLMRVRPSRKFLRGAVEDESRAQVIQQFPVWQRHGLQAPFLLMALIYGSC